MTLTARVPPPSVEDYLRGEQAGDICHEYVAGQVFAMAGVGETHNRIAGNLFFHLRAAAHGTPCGVFISDMKVRVAEHDAFYYPDVLLTCDPDDDESLYKTAPCLIAEVLSPSTSLCGRGLVQAPGGGDPGPSDHGRAAASLRAGHPAGVPGLNGLGSISTSSTTTIACSTASSYG